MKRQRPRNRMEEVARRAGVSLSTVSRALAGNPMISEETRRLVRATAERLEYRVDAAGSSLRTGLTRTVGVVIPLSHADGQGFSDPFFLEILGAIADELSARGYSMLLNKVNEDPTGWIAGVARARRADGVIVIGQSLHHEALNRIAVRDFPLVVWGARIAGQKYLTVGSDSEAGGYAATAHLLSEGCQHIIFLGDPCAPEVASRLAGHQRALAAAGVSRAPQRELPIRFGGDSAYHAVASLVDSGVEFDGIAASSDVFAIGAMRALAERGVKVPADVAVAGFDDIPFAACTTPPLTTVRQDCHAGARHLVDNLIRSIRREKAMSVVIPAELVVRASSLHEQYRALPALPARRRLAADQARSRRSRAG